MDGHGVRRKGEPGSESMSEPELEVFSAETGTAVRIAGRLDGSSAPVLDRRPKAPDLDPGLPMVRDLDGVDFVSSAGLRTLPALSKRVRAEGGSVVLSRFRPQVEEIFEISGFRRALKHRHSLAAALTESGMPADLCGEAGAET